MTKKDDVVTSVKSTDQDLVKVQIDAIREVQRQGSVVNARMLHHDI